MLNQENSIVQAVRPKPVVLIILDGWGVAPASLANAITQAKKPNFDFYCENYFCATLQASGQAVGLPYGEMGNSEVGHLNIGAGRIVYQDLPLINKAITDKEFFTNPIFVKALEKIKKNNSSLHLIGLFSEGGVHSSMDHLFALLELAKEQKIARVFIHAILDGRDMPYDSGLGLIEKVIQKTKELGIGEVATLSGRFWAMDRDNHWERIVEAYKAIVLSESEQTDEYALEAIKKSYEQKIYDEEFKPTVILNDKNQPITKVGAEDGVFFFNFRADRMRELVRSFVQPDFDKFPRVFLNGLTVVTMTEYEKNLPVEVAYPSSIIKTPLAKVISSASLKQLHIAETEKYAHVTYFINGGQEQAFPGEDHSLIPSPRIENYALQPEMSAFEIKEKVLQEINNNKYDFYVINFANPDMVAHTGDMKATIKAIEAVDKCLSEIVAQSLALDGVCVITADHGNAEKIINLQTGEIDKEHSSTPVPFLIIGKDYEIKESPAGLIDFNLLTPSGFLADVAPTVLKILNLPKPEEMTGRSLI